MGRKLISQREARSLRKRVVQLEQHIAATHHRFARDYPGGIHLGNVRQVNVLNSSAHAVSTARRLGFAVVATSESDDEIRLYAISPSPPAME